MTLIAAKTNFQKARYECDVCGFRGFWFAADWRWFGSFALWEASPKDCPTLCSDRCRIEFDERMRNGNVVIPRTVRRGYEIHITDDRRGY